MWITLAKRQFGAEAFPTGYGAWYFALQAGYAAGGGIAGWAYERFGDYGFLGGVALMCATAAVASLLLSGARQAPPAATPVTRAAS